MFEVSPMHQLHARWYAEYLLKKPLPQDAVVHFVDDDFRNIKRSNIRVFTSHDRHVREHVGWKEEG